MTVDGSPARASDVMGKTGSVETKLNDHKAEPTRGPRPKERALSPPVPALSGPGALSPQAIAFLQRSAGNSAVAELLGGPAAGAPGGGRGGGGGGGGGLGGALGQAAG